MNNNDKLKDLRKEVMEAIDACIERSQLVSSEVGRASLDVKRATLATVVQYIDKLITTEDNTMIKPGEKLVAKIVDLSDIPTTTRASVLSDRIIADVAALKPGKAA